MQRSIQSFLLVICLLYGITTEAQAPVANFTASPISGCAPLLVQFTNTSTNATSYQWNLGNSVLSTQVNPSTSYTIAGTYTVTLTATNANGSNTKTVTQMITVYPGPSVAFTANDTAGCPPHTVLFTNTTTSSVPGPITYDWIFGDGSPVAHTQNATHIYTGSNYYPVTLTATNSQGCVTSLTKPGYIHVYNKPTINFSSQTNYCKAPATVNFTSQISGSAPYQYQWDFGDGGNATTANPIHTYTSPNPYTVRLIVTDANGCRDTLTKQNYINIGNINPNFTSSGGCVFAPVIFTNTSNLADSVRWDFGDGGSDTTKIASHTYSNAGTFNVRLIVSLGLCKDTIVKPVTILPQPNAAFSYLPAHPCPAPSTVSFVNNSSGATSYLWDFGTSNSTLTSPSYTYNTNDTFRVNLIATGANGCKDTATTLLPITGIMTVMQSQPFPARGCAPFTVGFADSVWTMWDNPGLMIALYPWAIASYNWDFGDGQYSTLPTPSHTYTTPDNIYTCTLTITTVDGCTDTASMSVEVGSKPNASFTGYPDTACAGSPVYFINTSVNTSPYVNYIWDLGNNVHVVAKDLAYTYHTIGVYNVSLIADNLGCTDTFTVNNAAVTSPSTAKFAVRFSCDTPLFVQFYDTLSMQTTSHVWYFGDGNSTNVTNPTHTYAAPGTYNIQLVTFNSAYGCSDTMAQTIKLINPSLTFTTPDTAICKGDSIIFTPIYSDTTATGFAWWLNGQAPPWPYTSHNPNPSTTSWGYRFNQAGIYTVSVTATDLNGCFDSVAKTNYILVAQPKAGFYAQPPYGCAPFTPTFIDTTTNTPGAFQVTRIWDFGNGQSTVTTPSTTNAYNNAGHYTVKLIVIDNVGCTDTIIKPNYIDVRDPVPGFTASDSNACIGQLIGFNNSTTGATRFTSKWYFGDGGTDTAKNPIHYYTQTGSYTVTLVITDSIGCKDSLVKTQYINISKPSASFTVSDSLSVCPPLNVVITNTSTGAITYMWDLGNNSSSVLQNPTAFYTSPGVYTIRLIAVSAENCRDTAYKKVRVLGYSGALSYSPLSGCAPLEVGFKSQLLNVPSIVWDFSDGVTLPASGSDTTSHIYTVPGVYIPKLIFSDNTGCQTSSSGNDTIKVDGVDAGFIAAPLCINTPVTFTDTSFSYFSPVMAWKWSFNNGPFNSTVPNPVYTFPSTGPFPVTLIATNANGCVDTINTTVTINNLPVITAVADTSICKGDAAQLGASGGVSYVWSPAATLSCTNCPSPLATPSTPATYIVAGTDANGCINKDTVKVNIQLITTSIGSDDVTICADSSIKLHASGAQRYEWTPSLTLSNPNIADPIASPTTTTTYTVIAWEGSCLPDTHFVKVTVYSNPVIDAGNDVTIIAGTSTVLIAKGSNYETVLWSPAATLSCDNCTNPTASPRATTLYKVVATSDQGCRSFDTVIVRVLCDQSQLFIPNTFTPNGDGQNDVFYPRGEGLKMVTSFRVYNRWGEKVFEKTGSQLNDKSSGWDGTYKGAAQSPDVFVYVIEGVCESGEPISWKGDISLVR